ncbi:hypothetical protein VTK56DRAFT_8884 [Thermocarpiscus australiensis]
MGTGGFRPGCLEDTLCKQYTISVVRDPDDPTRVKPIVTYRINRNKIKEAEKTCKYRKQTSVAYSTTLVPFPLLDSASLVITRAIQMDALDLDVSYKSLRELLRRLRLSETGRIDIPWKKKFLNEPLFPLKYAEFSAIWNRCVHVIGSRKDIRLYSLRVGAGARMDDSLLSALRNYVIGHSEAVFENDY